MLRHKITRNRKGSSDVTILSGGRFLLAAAFIIFIIFPFFGKRLFGFIGGTGANAYSIDKGFADLITKVKDLQEGGETVPHPFTVDDGFYLVSFNYVEPTNGKATKPPDCNGIACFCVCTEPTCLKLDVKNNKGRDCRPLPGYSAIVAQKGIKGNDGQRQVNTYSDDNEGYYFYVKGEKTVAVNLRRRISSLYGSMLYIGKIK
ncbi:hypothetical protein HYU40_00580 [Candidatus Woesearchaeota archaeon]|nr:hypothetical protein [Candidatus Woesearchaeota archaeon]